MQEEEKKEGKLSHNWHINFYQDCQCSTVHSLILDSNTLILQANFIVVLFETWAVFLSNVFQNSSFAL